MSGGAVAENSANGSLVGTVTGTDADPGEILTYSLVSNPSSLFAINSSNGQITVANGSLLDYEAATSQSITVRVTDHAGLTFDKAFTIAVSNVVGVTLTGTDPSSGSSSYDRYTGQLVTQPATTGQDTLTGTGEEDTINGLGGPDTLSGLGGNDLLTGGAGNDVIDGGAGSDTAVFSGNYANYTIYNSGNSTFTIADTRSGSPDGIDSLVNVEKFKFADTIVDATSFTGVSTNHAPTGETMSGGAVAENSANGSLVGTVTGTDADPGEILTYSLVSNPSSLFAINSSNGQITVANGSLLDYEAATSQSITVRVTDHAGLTFDKAFTIAVSNVVGVTLTGTDPSSGSSSYDRYTGQLVTQPATTGQDTLTGTGEEDTINGLGGPDTLSGLGGNDLLTGGAGNDVIDGGAGSDTAVFSGNYANYTIYNSGNSTFTIADTRSGSPDGIDSLVNIETFKFADTIVDASSLVNSAETWDAFIFTDSEPNAHSLQQPADAFREVISTPQWEPSPAVEVALQHSDWHLF